MKTFKQEFKQINAILDRCRKQLEAIRENEPIMSDKEMHDYLQREYFSNGARKGIY